MKKINSRVLRALALAAGVLCSPIISAFAAPGEPVDEPVGARYSLGNTLWHLGHDVDAMRDFQSFLKIKNVAPETLFSDAELLPPASAQRILIEPELAPKENLANWKVEGDYITSNAGDGGTIAGVPITVVRPGLYRLWIRYYGWPHALAVTSLTIRHGGKKAGRAPLVRDEIYDTPPAVEGPTWKSILVDFEAGTYNIAFGPVTLLWQHGVLKDSKDFRYGIRMMDCVYATSEIWADAPDDKTLSAIKAGVATGIQWNDAPALSAAEKASWKAWRVRPISWEQAEKYPKLFALSREFWRKRVDELSRLEYSENAPPDYRSLQRQIIFDDEWNMVGNPVRIARQKKELQSDIDPRPNDAVWYWLYPGEFAEVNGDWVRQGTTLGGGWGRLEGTARDELVIDKTGEYHVWVHFRNVKYHEPWKMDVSSPNGKTISFVRDQQEYPMDIIEGRAWQKVGVVQVKAKEKMQFLITGMPMRDPATYRGVNDIFVTTDANYKPQGILRPALSRAQFNRRAARVGASEKDGYILRVAPGLISISQEWWPRAAEREDPQDARPSRKTTGAKTVLTHATQDLAMAREMNQSVQLYMRNLRDKAAKLKISGGSLQNASGKKFDGKIKWRVVAFAPLAASRVNWSPCILLRRPDVTLPPLNAAQIWLNVSSEGLPAGNYSGSVTLSSSGLPDQIVPLKIRVAAFDVKPQKPIYAGGYTNPPEGEEYVRAYVNYGMNIWAQPMPKAEMNRFGIRLLHLQQFSSDPAEYRTLFQKFKEMGLEYSDYFLSVMDEPSGTTEESLKDYITIAKAIHEADPKARVSFNPGESAKLETFKILDPYCDFWHLYDLHTQPSADTTAKQAFYSVKPWMWYTTPCYGDKDPTIATAMFNQIRRVPSMPGNIQGTEWFALYYPFRDAWDTAYEFIGDTSVMILPSRNGPIMMPSTEGIREGIQAANLATMVKERSDAKDEATQKLIAEGSTPALIQWLEKHATN